MAGQQRTSRGIREGEPNPAAPDPDQVGDEHGDEHGEQGGARATTWIADTFDGSTWIHDVDGESVMLEAGDEIPAGHEDKVLGHIPTTTTMPRSMRHRLVDEDVELAQLRGRAAAPAAMDFDPGHAKVDEVISFIRDNPEAAQVVLDRERAGKNRRTIFHAFGG